MAIFRNQMMPLQPQGGGIGGLFSRLRRPMTPPMGGFGGFGGGGFGPPPFDPRMRGGFPGMGGGFFGGFRPRFKRRPRPQMPDYSSQISGLEAKIAELQEQLAARQAATPMPDPVMDVAGPRIGTMGGPGFGEFPLGTAGPRIDPSDPAFVPPPMIGGMGPGKIQIPNISDGRLDALDLADIEERIANLNIDVGGEGGRPDMPPPRIFERGPGDGKVMQRPPSIARLPNITPDPVKPTRGPARLEPIKMPPLPMPIAEIIDIPGIPDEILRDVQSRGTVGPVMVPPRPTPVIKTPRGDAIKVPIKMPPRPRIEPIPAPMPEEMVLPATPQTGFFGKIQEAIEARRDPMEDFIPFVPPQINEPMPMPAPVMPAPMPMPSLPKFPMPQIDPMGRVAAPLTRGPVNTAINRPQVAMRGPGMRMR